MLTKGDGDLGSEGSYEAVLEGCRMQVDVEVEEAKEPEDIQMELEDQAADADLIEVQDGETSNKMQVDLEPYPLFETRLQEFCLWVTSFQTSLENETSTEDKMAEGALIMTKLQEYRQHEDSEDFGEIKRLWKAVAAGDNRCVDALQHCSLDLLKRIRPLDLDKILELIELNKSAGDIIEGNDIVLLLGKTGAGKTTTLHYLSGTSFDEVVVDGFDHFEPSAFKIDALKEFWMKAGCKSVTQAIQAVEIPLDDGKKLVVADSPGLNDTEGTEVDIANSIGVMISIRRAKCVKPVLVLARDGIGSRCEGLCESLRALSSLFSASAEIDFSSFSYLFTNYDQKDASKLHRRFANKLNNLTAREKSDTMFRSLLNMLHEKTTPSATIVFPTDTDSRELLLQRLFDSQSICSSAFGVCIDDASRDKLLLQLHTEKDLIGGSLASDETLAEAARRFQRIRTLSQFLPDAESFVEDVGKAIAAINKDKNDAFLRALDDFETAPSASACDILKHCVDTWVNFQAQFLPVETDAFRTGLSAKLKEWHQGLCSATSAAVGGPCSAKIIYFIERIRRISVAFGFDWEPTKTMFSKSIKEKLSSVEDGFPVFLKSRPEELPDDGESLESLCIHLNSLFVAEETRDLATAYNSCFVITLKGVGTALMSETSSAIKVARCPDTRKTDLETAAVAVTRAKLSRLMSRPGICSLVENSVASNCRLKQQQENLDQALIALAKERVVGVLVHFDQFANRHNHKNNGPHSLLDAGELVKFVRDLDVSLFVALDEENSKLIRAASMAEASAESEDGLPESYVRDCILIRRNLIDDFRKCDMNVVTGKWTTWTSFVSQENDSPQTFFSGIIRLLTGERSESQNCQPTRKLKEAMGSLVDELSTQLRCCCETLHASSRNLNEFMERGIFVVPIVLQFAKLLRGNSDLATTVVDKQVQSSLVDALFKSIRDISPIFIELSSSTEQCLTQGDFSSLLVILRGMERNQFFIESIHRIASERVPHAWSNITAPFSRAIDSLEVNIKKSPQYLELKDKLELSVSELQSLCQSSFLNSALCRSVNQHDHDSFFNRVATGLVVSKSVSLMNSFVSTNCEGIHAKLVEHTRAETLSVGKALHDMLRTLPRAWEQYKEIALRTNMLLSIEHCCTDAPGDLPGFSRRMQVEAESIFFAAIEDQNQMIGQNVSDDLTQFLVNLKMAGSFIGHWKERVNETLDKILSDKASKSDDDGLYLLNLATHLTNTKGDTSPMAHQIINEHGCFEGAKNALFNQATSRHGISYVLQNARLSAESRSTLEKLYAEFEASYESTVSIGVCKVGGQKCAFLQGIANDSKELASEYSMNYGAQLVELSANVFAYWTLNEINSIASSSSTSSDFVGGGKRCYLKKPHAAQVVAVWLLLNVENSDYQKLRSCFVEVLTGEGKSIVLGVSSLILALSGYRVDCVCYSKYLSERDWREFKSIFSKFGVEDRISYGSVKSLCEKIIQEQGELRECTRWFVERQPGRWPTPCPPEAATPRVLLVDEVDVLFKEDFFGNTHNPIVPLQTKAAQDLIEFVWQNRDTLTAQSLMDSCASIRCIDSFRDDVKPLVLSEIKSMLEHANHFSGHQYFISGQHIAYKHFDGLDENTWYGYYTHFAYLNEIEKGVLSESARKNIGLSLRCGFISYAEVPLMYDAILGVTGTLSALEPELLGLLDDFYDIRTMYFMPSVYGDNKLEYAGDNPRDTILCRGEAELFMEIRQEINTRRNREDSNVQRAVIVFFETSKQVEEFLESEYMKDLRAETLVVTESTRSTEKETIFLQATMAGAVSLMIREYGRGTDFKCYDTTMLDQGGVHVIQTFFSLDLAEEAQIKGRTARQGRLGSYSLVLDTDKLLHALDMSPNDVTTMRNTSVLHSFLARKRQEVSSTVLNERKEAIAKAEKLHYQSIDYLAAMQINDRSSVLKYLFSFNSCGTGELPRARCRTDVVKERKDRYAKMIKDERDLRTNARANAMATLDSIILSEGATHYTVLGLAQNCSIAEISSAFRKRALKYHPDKLDGFVEAGVAAKVFLKITEARDTLESPTRRLEYDEFLKRREEESFAANE